MTRYTLTFEAPACTVDAADTDSRRMAGIAIPYGEPGATSAGLLTIDAGAVKVPTNLRAVKLFREHGRVTPVGYATEAHDAKDALRMAFAVARTPDGDQALLEASEGLRDALSVELNNVDVKNGHVVAAELVAVAQVAVPAFANAVLTAALDDDAQAEVADLAGQIVDLTKPEETEETTEAPPTEDATMTEPTTAAAAPATLSMTPTAPARHPGDDRHMWAARAAEALRGATSTAQVEAALSDITPTSTSSTGLVPRPMWLGELWTPRAAARPLVNAIGVSPLTSDKVQGWKWVTEPVVAPYAGNKAAVPSSPAAIGPAEALAHRIAGGWDLDRIYQDFNTGFIEAFQAAAVRDYQRKSQSYFINGHAAITGPPAIAAADGILADATDLGPQADLVTAIQAVTGFLLGNGATVSFLAMAADAYSDFFALTSSEAPWWLAGQSSINLNGTVDIASTTVVVDAALPAGTILGGDRDAVTLYETGPINVNAVNLPNGGIDYGIFGYWTQLVHDDDGLAKATVTAVGGLSAETASAKGKGK
jgi:hypothetical protein